MFVITLVRINWKRESEKAMRCARGSSRLKEQQLPAEQDMEEDEEITQSEVVRENGDFLVMKEMGISEAILSEEGIPEQGDLSMDNIMLACYTL